MNDNLKRNLDEVNEADEIRRPDDDSVEGHINFKGLEGTSPERRVPGIGDIGGEDEIRNRG